MNTSATHEQSSLDHERHDGAAQAHGMPQPAAPLATRGPTPGKGVRIPKATLAAARAVFRHHAQRLEERRHMDVEPTSGA